MGRMPMGWVPPALGRERGAMEVSIVGTGSVSLGGGKAGYHCWSLTYLTIKKRSDTHALHSPGFGLTFFGHSFAGSDWFGEFCKNRGVLRR